ncbi:dual OB domain-containing protein [Photobacterium damselae]|uniref:dual OB domain-containing protein n=1 Tax=Photobacterium damselae TaxID=38293 RepID=UPI0015A14998|nr:hypothetical protein [Photobacterium damselae]NVO59508.1 hypothetical protein [Photobacterium damselae subsp. damselae]
MEKTIVCLANSRKHAGHCLAGKELDDEDILDWCRPVSKRDSRELSARDIQYKDGSCAEVFDVISFGHKGRSLHPAQEENFVNDEALYWEKCRVFNGDLDDLLDAPQSLWANGCSSYNGINDRVPVELVPKPIQSLYFIAPRDVEIIVRTEGAEFGDGRKRVRVRFNYNGTIYLLMVTDPRVEAMYLRLAEDSYRPQGQIYVTVSLGEDWNGFYYKLAAGVFEV